MARPGLIDGLKRWKVPDGSLKQLGRFIIEKCEEIWKLADGTEFQRLPRYSWKIQHGTAGFSIETGSFAVYAFKKDSFSSMLQIWAHRAYSIKETYGRENLVRNNLTLEELKLFIADWVRAHRIAELIPGLIA